MPVRRSTLLFLLVLLFVGVSASAHAQMATRSEGLRWVHPDPSSVRSFKAHWGVSPGVYGFTEYLGKPQATATGVYFATIDVPLNQTVYVALSAVGTNGLESRPSNVAIRTAPNATGLGAPGVPGVVGD